MKPRAKLIQFLMLLFSISLAFAQPAPPMPGARVYTQAELDQMLAPIALYPDSLLSQILMASTYPLEVVDAAHWSAANLDLDGEQAVRAVEQQSWDPSVKSLVAFPQVLRLMEEQLNWTERLGDAFLSQQSQVMDTVQNLRQKALAAGNLGSNEQILVEPQGQTIMIAPANPELVYVPYYDPTVVYGPWWWAAYPPVYWAPWPGYYARPGFESGFAWGLGITVGAGFFFGAFDWPHHHVNVNPRNDYYRGGSRPRNGRTNVIGATPNVWQHDAVHRRGFPYRAPPQPSGRARQPSETRSDFRGHELPSPELRGAPVSRPVPGPGVRPYVGSVPAQGRPNVQQRPPAFEGIGRGGDVRDSSRRGRSSTQEATPRVAPHSAAPPRPSAGGAAQRPGKTSEPRPANRIRDGKAHQ